MASELDPSNVFRQWKPPVLESARTNGEHIPDGDGPIIVTMNTVEREPICWLWPQKIARGKLSLVAGDPGVGKSFWTMDAAAMITKGRAWPDGSPCEMGDVILLNAEDDLPDTIRARLDDAGADVARVHALQGVRRVNSETLESRDRSFNLTDTNDLIAALEFANNPLAVIIDPVSAYLGGEDSHKNSDIRGLLAPLAKIASDYRVAIIMVTHLSKSGGARAMYRAMGSLAFIAAARSAWLVAKDKDDHGRRLFLPIKNNVGNDEIGHAFRLVDGRRIEWEAGPLLMKADEAIDDGKDDEKPGPDPKARNAALDWLRELLAAGPLPSNEVRDEAKKAEISWATVRRAQEAIGISPYRDWITKAWTWKLPAEITCSSSNPDSDNMSNLSILDNI